MELHGKYEQDFLILMMFYDWVCIRLWLAFAQVNGERKGWEGEIRTEKLGKNQRLS